MKPENYIVYVPSHDNRFALSVPKGGRIKSMTYLGGNVPTAAKVRTDGDTIMFSPDSPGIIGLSVLDSQGNSHEFIVEIRQIDSKWIPALQEIYFSRAENVVYAFRNQQLRVLVNGMVFASGSGDGVDHILPYELLYDLLFGRITPEQAIAAVAEQEGQERERRQVADALKEIRKIENYLDVTPGSSAFDAVIQLNLRCESFATLARRGQIIEELLCDQQLLGQDTKTECLSGELRRRVVTAVTLLNGIRNEWSSGKWGLWSRIKRHYDAYRQFAGETAHFAPSDLDD